MKQNPFSKMSSINLIPVYRDGKANKNISKNTGNDEKHKYWQNPIIWIIEFTWTSEKE